MRLYFKRLFSILGFNTVVALMLAIGSTVISMYFNWRVDFPLTIIGIAIVFPIVFSIGGAYKRREAALAQYALMKSMGRVMYFASRDWLRDPEKSAAKNREDFRAHIVKTFSLCIGLFQSAKNANLSQEERAIYKEFSCISKSIEDLRDRGLSGSEVSRVNAYLSRFITAFETVKHIHQYRTPITLRMYSRFFIYIILIVLGPYFALLAEGQALWLAFVKPVIFAMVFTGLDNIQEHLENPFDQVGEDDIRINPDKFMDTLNE